MVRLFSLPGRAAATLLAAVALAALCVLLLKRTFAVPSLPPANTSRIEVRAAPNVLLAVRDLARLETTSFHIERVVELSDEQTRLFGLIDARDAILLVAVGDVTAGVDLSRISDGDARVDWPARRVRLVLPAPEVFSAALDNAQTHVHTRTTDTLASRREDLESRAREEAERTMRQGAIDSGILPRAQSSAERALRALLHSLGFEQVELAFTPVR